MTLNSLLNESRPIIMGILNLTPDSFSDGGSYTDKGRAVYFASRMVKEGADIIDVGGESTRPNAQKIPAQEQLRRVIGVIESLRQTLPARIPISIDTSNAEVARKAVEAGASIINDVRSGRDDEGIFKLAAEKELPIILMHMQGTPQTMQDNPQYDDVVREIQDFLLERSTHAMQVGVPKKNIIIDPGIGFGKTREHNLTLLANLKQFTSLGFPVLLGASRKRFLGDICATPNPQDLVGATCTTTTLGQQAGVRIFRVHDVQPNRQAADMTWAVQSGCTPAS